MDANRRDAPRPTARLRGSRTDADGRPRACCLDRHRDNHAPRNRRIVRDRSGTEPWEAYGETLRPNGGVTARVVVNRDGSAIARVPTTMRGCGPTTGAEVMRDAAVLPPDIRAYLEAENAYTEAAMADVEELRLGLFGEMRGRIKEDNSSVPAPDGDFAYATRYEEGAEHPLIVRSRRDGGDETVLLDANAMAQGHAYFRLGDFGHSPDHRLLAYAVDDKGAEYFTIHVRDIETGEDLADRIDGTTGDAVWAADGKTFFYVWVDDNHRPARVYRHVVGTSQADDVIVFEDRASAASSSASARPSRGASSYDRHPRPRDLGSPRDRRRPTGRRAASDRRAQDGRGVSSRPWRRPFFILTNADDAEDFKIVTAPVATPGREHWRDPRPASPGRLILNFTVYKDFLVRLEREGSLPRIVIRHLASGEEHADRLRRGGLFARHARRLRVRHRRAALHLFVDDDAGPRLRLRHGDARRACCARRTRSPPATTRPTT